MESLNNNLNDNSDNSDEQNFSNVSLKIGDEKSIDGEDEGPTNLMKNINELKVLDFYSADDVRQSIKSALANKAMMYKKEELTMPKIKEITLKPIANESEETQKGKDNISLNSQDVNKVEEVTTSGNINTQIQENGRKKRGRPIKAGPSKKAPKQYKVDDFYVGKLSNYVPYKRNGGSESDFDSESGVLY